MGNMSYCRFENTLGDLRDCFENMEGTLSESETRARKELIEVRWYSITPESHEEDITLDAQAHPNPV